MSTTVDSSLARLLTSDTVTFLVLSDIHTHYIGILKTIFVLKSSYFNPQSPPIFKILGANSECVCVGGGVLEYGDVYII